MKGLSVLRRLFLLGAALGLALATTGSISTSGFRTVTYTQPLDGMTVTFPFPSSNSCLQGAEREVKLTSTGSFRVTILVSGPDTGAYWISPSQTGTFQVMNTSESGDPEYTGNFELESDGNQMRHGDQTFVLKLQGVAADGTPLSAKLLERLSVTQTNVKISMASPSFFSVKSSCA